MRGDRFDTVPRSDCATKGSLDCGSIFIRADRFDVDFSDCSDYAAVNYATARTGIRLQIGAANAVASRKIAIAPVVTEDGRFQKLAAQVQDAKMKRDMGRSAPDTAPSAEAHPGHVQPSFSYCLEDALDCLWQRKEATQSYRRTGSR